jgi:endonuclease/exonuclease/phosphatase family metal-dependent hydrolase
MTWNIHGGGPSRRNRDLHRIVDLVRRHAPDIVALQEIDARRRKGWGEPAFEFLKEGLGAHSAEARVIAGPDGDYGHAVISRWPIRDVVFHDVSFGRHEPRAALEATVETFFGDLHVVAAHLGLSFRERRHQAALLAGLALAGPSQSIMLGDFNDWVWRGSVQCALGECMDERTHHKTFPAWLPAFALDRIYCRPAGILLRSWTDPDARSSSDHLPVIAELALNRPGAQAAKFGTSRIKVPHFVH